MKILHYLAGALIPALAFTSCLNSGDEAKNEATYTYANTANFNYVRDLETDETTILDGATYKIHYDYSQSNVTVDISGLKVAEDLAQVSLKLPTLPFTTDLQSGLFVTRQNTVVPTNAIQNNYVFDTFTLRANPDRLIYVGGQLGSYPIYLPAFELNSRYQVTVFPVQSVYLGTTLSESDKEGSTTFKFLGNLFAVTIDYKKLTASISVVQSMFAENMPAKSFEIKNLPIQFNETGYTIVTDPEVTYPIYTPSNKVMENCYVSDVRASSFLNSGATGINFTLDLSGIDEKGFDYGVYKVRSSLTYYGTQESDKN